MRVNRDDNIHLDVEAAFCDPETLERIMAAWASGCSVLEMGSIFGLVPEEINRILDRFAPLYYS